MTRKPRKSKASPWEYHAALIAVRWRGEATPECGRPVLMKYVDKDEDKDEQRIFYFYKALLELPRLAPGIRNAVMRELGLLPQEQNRKIEEARTEVFRMQIVEEKERLRKKGAALDDAALENAARKEVARVHGMDDDALRKRVHRLDHPRPRKRAQKHRGN
jgi:rRNA-processing protein FCF1